MRLLLSIVTAAVLHVSAAFAQTPLPAQDFAARTVVATMFGIESATLVVHKTHSPEIRSFAQRLANGHGLVASNLRQIMAPRSDIALPERPDGRRLDLLRDLAAMQGPEFEKAYVAAQREAQADIAASVAAYTEHGTDAELRAFAEKALPTLQALDREAQTLPTPR